MKKTGRTFSGSVIHRVANENKQSICGQAMYWAWEDDGTDSPVNQVTCARCCKLEGAEAPAVEKATVYRHLQANGETATRKSLRTYTHVVLNPAGDVVSWAGRLDLAVKAASGWGGSYEAINNGTRS